MKNKKLFWILLEGLIILCLGIFYLTAQQSLRLGANEPQKSMAQDAAKQLEAGAKPETLAGGYIDMANNMAPFIIIYNEYGVVVAGNGYLDNSIPQVPVGVLAASKDNRTNAVTWQPKANVRIASVSVHGGSYYVLGGRSLSIVEKKINTITNWVLGLLAVSVIITIAGVVASSRKKPEIS